ncbi:MAG: MoxR family ATPase [Firmicutes bacterium]|nr:MoxR family ATPase [Bacillota bacterium]
MFDISEIEDAQVADETASVTYQNSFELCEKFISQLESVVLGNREALLSAAIAVFAGGHLLLEDVPGVGKTTLAKAVAKLLGGKLSRIQGNPDLLPSDILGINVYSPKNNEWEFYPGPIFADVVLFDELNRTPARSQSALLEAMEETQVSIDGHTYRLPLNHLIIATQNPTGHRGTYPLVESQLDRFLVSAHLGYPDISTEIYLAKSGGTDDILSGLNPLVSIEQLGLYRNKIAEIYVSDKVARYSVEIIATTRRLPEIALGASPRASIALLACSKVVALLSKRDFVAPEDIQLVVKNCLAHRLIPTERDDEQISHAYLLLDKVLSMVEIPL